MFVSIVGMLFEAAAQSPPRGRATAAAAKPYKPVPIDDPQVKTALGVALNDQQSKNRTAIKIVSVLTSELQTANGENYRLCLSIDRRGRLDTARVVVQRSLKNKWSVALWAWNACSK